MIKIETTEQIRRGGGQGQMENGLLRTSQGQRQETKSSTLSGTSFTKEAGYKYTDYAIISGLSSRRGKRDFISWVDQEFAEVTLDTTEYRVHYMAKMMKKTDVVSVMLKDEKSAQIIQEEEQILPSSGGQESDFILDLESTLIPVLARMESRGVAFDKEKLTDIGVRIRRDIASLETHIYAIIGERVNLNSPKQLQVILFEKMGIKPMKKNKTGYSVDNDVLEEIAKTYDIARLILEYRGLAKLSSTYVEGLLRSIDTDGQIHTTYDSLGAATGRMSSNDPNLQNIPTGDGYAREIKECFISTKLFSDHKDNLLLVADYSQIELRILAFLSQDASLLDAFAQDEDIHARTAFFLFGDKLGGDKTTWKATSEQRRIAKSVNFGVIYGITGFGLAKTLNCSPWEAQEYVNAFYEKYPGVRVYYDNLLEDARKNGYVETYFGRRRYIPGVNDANKTIRSISEREAMNMPVQGTAADIIKVAMIEIDAKIREGNLKGRMILQVHDELVFDIPSRERKIFEKLVRDTMEGVLQKYESGRYIGEKQVPPITVDISTGKNWAEAK